MSDAWDRGELRASVQAYLEMLGMERSNQPYIKRVKVKSGVWDAER